MLFCFVSLTLTKLWCHTSLSYITSDIQNGGICLVVKPVRKTGVSGQSNQMDEGDPSNQVLKNQTILFWRKELVFSEITRLSLRDFSFCRFADCFCHTDVKDVKTIWTYCSWRVGSWMKSGFLINMVNWKFECCACSEVCLLLVLHYLGATVVHLSFSHSAPYPLFCRCDDPISPARSIKFHLSYRSMKRSQSSQPLKDTSSVTGNCNFCSITSARTDKWDALLLTHSSIRTCEDLLFCPFRGLVQQWPLQLLVLMQFSHRGSMHVCARVLYSSVNIVAAVISS